MSDHKKSPIHTDDQEWPEQERMVTPAEEAGQDLEELENPPQAEGSRKVVEEDLEEKGKR
jgi:hypothetical protein